MAIKSPTSPPAELIKGTLLAAAALEDEVVAADPVAVELEDFEPNSKVSNTLPFIEIILTRSTRCPSPSPRPRSRHCIPRPTRRSSSNSSHSLTRRIKTRNTSLQTLRIRIRRRRGTVSLRTFGDAIVSFADLRGIGVRCADAGGLAGYVARGAGCEAGCGWA
jgi:hypothetical protein